MDKEATLNSFKSITGASDEEAKFYLEANKWDLDVCNISLFGVRQCINSE